MDAVDLAIVGAGASGTLVLAHLAQLAQATRSPMRVVLLESGTGRVGAGSAYRTGDDAHLLNTRAGDMSAWQDWPDHFVRWAGATGRGVLTGAEFVPRGWYGSYLCAVAHDSANSATLHTRIVRAQVLAANRDGDLWQLTLDGAAPIRARQVVLATGVEPPTRAHLPEQTTGAERFVADPWRPGALDLIDADDPVLILGTGLTAVDVALSLAPRLRRPVTAVSRHGLLPTAHLARLRAPMPLDATDAPTSLRGLRSWVQRRVRASVAAGGDWRPAIDGLRPHSQQLWNRLGDADRVEFLRRDLSRWKRVRHRIPPRAATAIGALLDTGQLVLRAADAATAITDATRCTWIINALGPETDPARSANPLLRHLLATGNAAPGPQRRGLATTVDGQLVDPHGHQVPGLWTLGGTRQGQLFESTAIREIRTQAYLLALRLTAARLPRQSTADPADEFVPDRRVA